MAASIALAAHTKTFGIPPAPAPSLPVRGFDAFPFYLGAYPESEHLPPLPNLPSSSRAPIPFVWPIAVSQLSAWPLSYSAVYSQPWSSFGIQSLDTHSSAPSPQRFLTSLCKTQSLLDGLVTVTSPLFLKLASYTL